MRLLWLPVLFVASVAAGEADERGYELRVAPDAVEVEVGAEGAVSLTIAPAEGYTIDRDGPMRVRVAVKPGKGLELPKTRFRREDAADARADSPRFDLRYKAAAAGEYTVAIEVRFWICRKYTCRAAREARDVPVSVRAPAPPPPPPDDDAGPPAPQ